MRKSAVVVCLLLWACDSKPPAPSAPAPAPTPAPAPAPAASAAPADAGAADAGKKSKLAAAPTDGLSLAERVEKRKAEEAKLAKKLAADEHDRLLKYDKTKLKQHNEMFAFIKKTQAEYDKAKSAAAVEKLQAKLQKPIIAAGKKVKAIDPKTGNSNVVTDYDVMLNSLANDYPAALAASFDGDKQPIAEQRAEMAKRTKKIESWLKEVKASK